MKKNIFLLFFLFPVVAFTQFNLLKDSPLDYAWKNVGNAGFSLGEAGFTSLAFNPLNGQPYVAYADNANSNKATVMKFDGTNWVNLGGGGFSISEAPYTSLTFSPSDRPYVSFCDYGNNHKVTVMKFDSVFVGIKETNESILSVFPNPTSDYIRIEMSENAAQNKITIMNLSGQELITRQITETKTQLDISALPSGVYFVRLTGERMVKVGKIIKQ